MISLFDLTGKKAIVTGGASGLGRGLAEGLHGAGADVTIIDITDKVDEIANEIGKSGAQVFGVKGNLGDREQLKQAFDASVTKLGDTLDIIVNCAGIQRRNPCEDFTSKDWDDVLSINLTATFLLGQMAARIMLAKNTADDKNKGKIINIASVLSFFGGYTVPAYAASKGGVAQLTKAFSNEWASRGINVNAIAPGYMATPLNTAIMADEKRNNSILSRIPANRWGTPEDMHGLIIFLASEASNYVNGAIIPVDGGYLGC